MGLETIAILGLSLLQADAQIKQSEDQAQAVIDQANLDAENKSKETRLRAARQQVSFLNSGLTLQGTPLAAINNTFQIGIADINQITSNAEKQAKNIISSGRTQALSSLASGVSGASFGAGNVFGNASFALQTGGQSFFDGGFENIVGSAQGKFGPGF